MPLSLVGLSGVLEPTRLMATTWITMRPMYYAALGVPLEHAVERDGVTRFQRGKARREVDVVSNEQRLARSKGQNKALVTAAFVVIGKQLCDVPSPVTWVPLFCSVNASPRLSLCAGATRTCVAGAPVNGRRTPD